ncbi:hypothetical protein [Phytoactinopolyspora halotolerans]|uniref:Uncharacterized protein n=1 Tax=Phytoactinopolyspora halotolerans TaxID=1981512 RepID=A0A6L9SFC8_9ACTN|nr:hypothetical protein [Phytoactinopolyspora halotolerans]NEE03847.1 hypothetical protein [Phytoactinopolyspora halotolerans]
MSDPQIREQVERIGETYAEVKNAMADLDREMVRLEILLSPWGGDKP